MAGWGTNHVRGPGGFTAFVPNGYSRKETAILLVGTADEYGIDQRAIRAVLGGFFVSDELADVLGEDAEADEIEESEEPEADEAEAYFDPSDYTVAQVKVYVEENPEVVGDVLEAEIDGKDRATLTEWLIEFSDNKTSGNRAEKNTGTDKE